jgi:hypothetical protein
LAAAFAYCYEKSWFTDWIDSDDAGGLTVDEERLAVCKARDEYATNWYSFLERMPTVNKKYSCNIEGLKIDTYEPTYVAASFLMKNSKSGTYEVVDGSDKSITDGTIAEHSGLLKTFKTRTKLKPNNDYKLILNMLTTEDKKRSSEISFTTPQEYPIVSGGIKLTTESRQIPNNKFKLSLDAFNVDWGYWKKNSNKFLVQLIVNGQVISKKEITTLPEIWSFDLSADFGYLSKIGDTIQISICAWTKDDSGKKIFNNDSIIVSNSVCMLAKPVTAYLNIN